jgi:hypothetical protein
VWVLFTFRNGRFNVGQDAKPVRQNRFEAFEPSLICEAECVAG